MSVCYCSDPECGTKGCRLSRAPAEWGAWPGVRPIPPYDRYPEGGPLGNHTRPVVPLTEEDVRRMVRDEIAKWSNSAEERR